MNSYNNVSGVKIKRLIPINKYTPHKEKHERICACCNNEAIFQLQFVKYHKENKNGRKQYKSSSIYLCEEHKDILKQYLEYF